MKNLLHKSFIRKLAVISAVWLISSNLLSMIPNPVYADDWNTATLTSWADGYTITYDGKSYTLASSDLTWTYYRWFNENIDNSERDWDNYWVEPTYDGNTLKWNTYGLNNIWWWGSDNRDNWYNPNPTNLDARKWPCDPWYHVPSRWEWNAIVTAWCHLDSNTCTSSDLQHADDRTASNNLIYIEKPWLRTKFKSDFGMSDGLYWSSSPNPDFDYDAWSLYVYDDYVRPEFDDDRTNDGRVRCLKNSTSAWGWSSSSALSWAEVYSRSEAGTLTDNPLTFIMPNYDVYLYANTAPNEYYVHYDGNGSTAWSMSDSGYTYDTTWYLAPNAFQKSWYTWTGWNTQANGGGTSYGSGAAVHNWRTDTWTTTIYAQWSVNGYQITYHLNGWTGEANPEIYTVESEAITLHNPTRTNSIFLWWSWTDISGTTGTVIIPHWSIWNRVYEANFRCNTWYHLSWANNCVNNTYDVVVQDGDWTHWSADPVVFTYDQTGSLPKMPAQSWYDFIWWEVTWMSGWVEHYIGTITTTWDSYTYSGTTNEFTNLTIEQGGTVTLTALWQAKTDTPYVVYHYVKDLGTNTYTLTGTDYRSWTTDTEVVLSGLKKTFTWFEYSGWYLTGGTTRPAWAGVATWNIEKDGSLKIYLYYNRAYKNVTLSGDAHVAALSGAWAYEYGATVTAEATPMEWYHFFKWDADPDPTGS